MEVASIQPETARMIENFVKKGGRIICIGELPYQTSGLANATENNKDVNNLMQKLKKEFPNQVREVTPPTKGEDFLAWYTRLRQTENIVPFVKISQPNKFFSQNYYKAGPRDIFFFVNSSKFNPVNQELVFPATLSGKQAWLWDAETGERYLLPQEGNKLTLRFGPGESKVIVFEKNKTGNYLPEQSTDTEPVVLENTWISHCTPPGRNSKNFHYG